MVQGRKNIDATAGPLFSKIIAFVIPLMLTNLIQQLYSMADSIVVGQFSGDPNALAEIGCTASLVALLTAFVTGFSAGAGVLTAKHFGARDYESLSQSVHTSFLFSVIIGVALSAVSLLLSKPILDLLGTKPELANGALVYVRILLVGIPAVSVYNFSAAALRAVGDSKTPFYILTASGLLNVFLNLFFVIVMGMSIDGVAIATVAAQYASAIAVTTVLLMRKSESYRIVPSKLSLHAPTLRSIIRIGLPAAIQASLFGITNLFLTAALNGFDASVISARTIAFSIDTLLATVASTYVTVTMTFGGQNYGARKYSRIKKTFFYSLLQVFVLGVSAGALMIIFNEPLVRIYVAADAPNISDVIAAAKIIMTIMLTSYPIGFVNDAMTGFLRGLGRSILPMIVSILGICVFRIIWILFVFPSLGTVFWLFMVYPISWAICLLGNSIMSFAVMKKIKSELAEPLPLNVSN